MRYFGVAAIVFASMATFVACDGGNLTVSPTAQDRMPAAGADSTLHRFAKGAAPTISSIDPTSGAVGATVVINGTGFAPPLSIAFAGNAEASGSFSPTMITVTVPSGALTGPITVTTQNGSAQSQTFTVDGSTPTPTPSCTPAAGQVPTICSVDPKSAMVGATITIDGYHLAPLKSIVFNKGVVATASATVRKITAQVPAGAISGPIKVTTKYGTVESGRFVVEPSAATTRITPDKR